MYSLLRRLWNCLFNRMAVYDNVVSVLPPFYVLEMVTLVRALNVVAELDIADRLHAKKMNIEELAAETRTQVEPLYRILRTLAAFGFFREKKNRVFVTTKKSGALRSDTPESIKDWMLYTTSDEVMQVLRQSLEVVKTGQGGFQIVFGKHPYGVLYDDPDHEKTGLAFVRGMGKFTEWQSRIVARSYDFGSASKVVDIAGGHGFLISRILQAYPHLKGVMVDQPFSIEHAEKTVADSGVADRCQLIVGDMFDPATLPDDGDIYTIKHVLWDWDDTNALKILQSVRKAIPSHAKLIIIENAISSDNDADGLGKLFDLELLFYCAGKSRTKEEWLQLTRAAGFSFERVKSTACFDVKLMIFNPIN